MIRTIIPARGRKLATLDPHRVKFSFDKNHNPRKGTETYPPLFSVKLALSLSIRTIIPARGRKPSVIAHIVHDIVFQDKNHNPRKGTETGGSFYIARRHGVSDKNHNPRKGTETIPLENHSEYPG